MSRMNSIRNAAKTAGLIGATGAVAGASYGMSTNKDAGTTGAMAGYGALGALGGFAAGKYGKALGMAPRLAMGAAGQKSFSRAGDFLSRGASTFKPSGFKGAIGSLGGAGLGMAYASLPSNRTSPTDYNARLAFEEKRKKMTVEQNLHQMREMRSIMNDTRMR